MNDQQKKEQYSGVRDQEIRAALDQHWAASDANDFETEHRIYHEDAVLEYPQSGERTRGRRNIQNQRASQPSKKRFTVRRIIGGGDLWVTAANDSPDGKPLFARLTSALALYIPSTAGSLAGLRVVQHRILVINEVLRFKIVGIGGRPMQIQCRTDLLISDRRRLLLLLLIAHFGL